MFSNPVIFIFYQVEPIEVLLFCLKKRCVCANALLRRI